MGVLDSVRRQFDDTEGGGFVDETVAVLDPTRAASESTEEDVREVASNPGVTTTFGRTGMLSLLASDTLDTTGDQTPPQLDDDRDTPTTTPEGDGEWWSGDSPVDAGVEAGGNAVNVVDAALPDWLPYAAGGVVVMILGGVALYLLNPLLTIIGEVVADE